MPVDSNLDALPIALLGADALLAARPATPVQVAHACLAVGFAAAYPVSWGEELIAERTLAVLERRSGQPLAICACPHARRALCGAPPSLEQLEMVAPPVATARLVRAAYADRPVRITYLGACPSATDESIDAHLSPSAFLEFLVERGIVLAEQPEVYESVLPPDRRRFLSQPGGAPAPDRLPEGWQLGGMSALGVDSPATMRYAAAHPGTLADVAPEVGCVCSGYPEGRGDVVALEPPRSPSPVMEPGTAIDLTIHEVRPSAPIHRVDSARMNQQDEPRPPAPSPQRASAPERESSSAPTPEPESPPAPATDLESSSASAPEAEPITAPPSEPEFTSTARPERPRPEPPLGARRPQNHDSGPRREQWVGPIWPERIEEVQPRRRFSFGMVLLSAAVGLLLPFAVVGGWLLYRDGLDVLRHGPSYAGTSPVYLPATVPTPSPTDSAAALAVPDSILVDSVTRADSSSRGVADSVRENARGTRDSAGGSVRVPIRPSEPETRRSGRAQAPRERAASDSTRIADSARIARESTAREMEALRIEIARRRARMDSLARVVDSLGRTKPPQRRFR